MKGIKVILKTIAASLFAGAVLVQGASMPVHAAEQDSMSVSLVQGDEVGYYRWSTCQFSLKDGTIVYCGEPKKESPKSGTYTAKKYDNDTMRALLYYGYGGPGYKDSTYGLYGKLDDDQKKMAYQCMHIMVSWVLDGMPKESDAFHGVYEDKIDDYKALTSYYTTHYSKVPAGFLAYVMGTGSGNQRLVFGTWNPDGYFTLKKTSQNVTITANNGAYSLAGAVYGIYSDKSCKNLIMKVTTAENGTVAKTEVPVGAYYVKEITAPKGYVLDTVVYSLKVESGEETALSVSDAPIQGKIKAKKISAGTELSEHNSCYSLAGAQFSIYQDAECTKRVGIVTTKADGSSNELTVPLGTYYVAETKAPEGYARSAEVKKVTVSNTATVEFSMADQPQSNPVALVLEKWDAETNEKIPQAHATLADAEFEISYYDTLESGLEARQPLRHWIMKTDEQGEIRMDQEHLVSGDAFYRNSENQVVFPIGTVCIREIKAPYGYEISTETWVCQIKSNGESETLHQYQTVQVAEQLQRGEILIIKKDATTGNIIPIAGTKFRILDEKGEVALRDENGQEAFETDESGSILLPEKLPLGNYYLEEVEAPVGYLMAEAVLFSVTENALAQPIQVICEDYPAMGQIHLIKYDVNDKNLVLQGACYEIIAAEDIRTGDGTIRYQKGEKVGSLTTDEHGEALSELLYLGRYELKEVSAPNGYAVDLQAHEVILSYQNQLTKYNVQECEVSDAPLVVEEPEKIKPVPKTEKVEKPKKEKAAKAPKTGDAAKPFLYASMAAGAAAVLLFGIRRKMNRS